MNGDVAQACIEQYKYKPCVLTRRIIIVSTTVVQQQCLNHVKISLKLKRTRSGAKKAIAYFRTYSAK